MNNPQDIFMLSDSLQDSKLLENLDRNIWKAEFKYDGERVMLVKKGSEIVFFNRRGNIITFKFREVVEALKLVQGDFMIDSEVINIDNTICGNFNLLSRRALTKNPEKIKQLESEIPVMAKAFDILALNGKSLVNEPLYKRKQALRELLKDNISEHLEMVEYDDINNTLARVIEGSGEGIIIKNINSPYESRRSKNCLKHKLFRETTITITGFTENPSGIRATDKDEYIAVQISGLQSEEVKQKIISEGRADINIQYLTKSEEGKYRFPSFRGLVK
jgi:ATP-dependent DNA ligase